MRDRDGAKKNDFEAAAKKHRYIDI